MKDCIKTGIGLSLIVSLAVCSYHVSNAAGKILAKTVCKMANNRIKKIEESIEVEEKTES